MVTFREMYPIGMLKASLIGSKSSLKLRITHAQRPVGTDGAEAVNEIFTYILAKLPMLTGRPCVWMGVFHCL